MPAGPTSAATSVLALSGPPWPAERRHQLLALLAVRSGEWVTRDELAALFWPDRPLADARRNLRKVIFRARELPGAATLRATEQALCWPVATDWQALQAALRAGQPGQALAWRQGPLLAGLDDASLPEFGAWLAAERNRFDAAWRQAALAHLPALAAPDQRAGLARQLLALDPLDEDAVAALMDAELARGQADAARHAYQDYARQLASTLGVEPARALRERVAPRAAAPQDDDIVGRQLELAEIAQRLHRDRVRLLTLTGPGGVGKSRLVRAAGTRLARAGGAVFGIDLQDLTDPEAVVSRLGTALGLEVVPGQDRLRRLQTRLAQAPALLVLDNAEHLPGLPDLLGALLGAAPALQLIVTSRRPLGLAQESVLRVDGLALPDEESRDAEAAASFDAVRLFVERARRARPDFALAPHLAAVLAIVDAVGGLPLAIELAAGWVRLLPPEEIARDLALSIDDLARDPGSADPPQRPEHSSLRALLEPTWSQLAQRERAALAALAVFGCGFTRSAALAVAQATLPLLSSLVDRGLLGVDEHGRFALHPVVRQFAGERLAADPALRARVELAHAAHFLRALAVQAADHNHRRPLVQAYVADEAELLRAWHRALAARDTSLLAAAAPALWPCLETLGRLQTGIALFRAALALPEQTPGATLALARVRHALATLLYRHHELTDARDVAAAGVALAERCADPGSLAGCLGCIGSTWSAAGQPAQAQPWLERALGIARDAGLRRAQAMLVGSLGIVAKQQGRFDDALQCYEQALAIDREIGDPLTLTIRLNALGGLHAERAAWPEARRWYDEGLRLCERHGVVWLRAYLAYGVGLAEVELGLAGSAGTHLAVALQAAQAGELQGLATAIEGLLGRAATLRGETGPALRHLQQAAAAARRLDDVTERLSVLLYFGDWLRATGRLRDAARVWRGVAGHDAAEAGLRASADRWCAALGPGADAEPALGLEAAEALLDTLR